MTNSSPIISRWVYLLFMLAVLALVVSLVLNMRAYQTGQAENLRLGITQSQQLLSERMFSAVDDAARRGELAGLIDEFDQLQEQVESVPDTLLYKPQADTNSARQSIVKTAQAWALYRDNLPDPVALNAMGGLGGQDAPDFEALREISDTLSDWMQRNDASGQHLESAGHLVQLADAIASKVSVDADGTVQAAPARGAWLFFDQILNSLEVAVIDAELDKDTTGALVVELRAEFSELDSVVNGAVGEMKVSGGRVARADLLQSHSLLNIALDNQLAALNFGLQSQQFWFRLGTLAALAAVGLLCLGSVLLLRASRRLSTQSRQSEKHNQDSILRLLDEISALAEGDLNTRATVSEDMTGAIADSINYAVSELRRLVSAITSSADRVTVAVEETGSSAQQLARASSVQSREIQRSATYLTAMAETMEQMSQRSMEAAQIASQTVEKSVGGRRSVEKTVDGMGRIRSQIMQTSGLLKRLDESSKQIGEIVGLINEVTGRSRLLALNSAIHSNSGSQENHRFTSIANEVQTLSSTLKEAAQEIATLVNIIQDDARAASESMELTTTEVREGSELAKAAGDSLHEIETISRRLSVVVEHLSKKTRKQSDVVNQLSLNMGVINDVTRRSAHGMQLSAAALEDLRHMATELRDGVQDFAMPPAAGNLGRNDDMVGRPLLKKREMPRSAVAAHTSTHADTHSLAEPVTNMTARSGARPGGEQDTLADNQAHRQPDSGPSVIEATSLSATSRVAVGLVRNKLTTADG